jgi:hypothetical protein
VWGGAARSRWQSVCRDSGPEIHWDLGILQYSHTITGPWTDLPAPSPFPPPPRLWRTGPLSPVGEQGFFRVKVSSFAEASHFAAPTSDMSEGKEE